MISIDTDNNIVMTRGDTLSRPLNLKQNGETYTLEEDDVIRFAMAKVYKGKTGHELLIKKTIDNSTMQLVIDPEDTADLDYGKYVYDIQITFANGDVVTVLAKKTLTLTEEVD